MSGEVRGGSSAEKAVAGPFSGLESDTTIPWWQVDLGREAPTGCRCRSHGSKALTRARDG